MKTDNIEEINKDLKIVGYSKKSGICPFFCGLKLYIKEGVYEEISPTGYFIKLNSFFYHGSKDYLSPSKIFRIGYFRAWARFMHASYKDLLREVK